MRIRHCRVIAAFAAASALAACATEFPSGISDIPSFGVFFLEPQNGSGIRGFGSWQERPNGRLDFAVSLSRITLGARYRGHMHAGTTCSANGPVLLNLNDIVGVAPQTPDTIVTGTAAPQSIDQALRSADTYVDYHAADAPEISVACTGFSAQPPIR